LNKLLKSLPQSTADETNAIEIADRTWREVPAIRLQEHGKLIRIILLFCVQSLITIIFVEEKLVEFVQLINMMIETQ
jgi:hypothetical protein